MRFFLSKRLPFGLRAGFSTPLGGSFSRQRQRSPGGVGYVYVIAAADGMVKVGQTTNPRVRLATLQTASRVRLDIAYLLATDQDPGPIEASAHRILAPFRCSGEWFDVHPDVATNAVDQAAAALSGAAVGHTDTDRLGRAIIDGRIPLTSPRRSGGRKTGIVLFLVLFVAFFAMLRYFGG